MEQEIRRRYSDRILQEAAMRFRIPEGSTRELDGFESFIFEFERADGEFILRIAHSRRRSEALIRGEVDWINYLAAGGAGVAPAILSERGQLVEPIDDGYDGQFLATAFVKAPGKSVWEQELSPTFDQDYGQLIGKLHALSKSYVPNDPIGFRPHWDDPINLDIASMLPAGEDVVLQKHKQLQDYLAQLPKDTDSYGLIHQDAHGGNFFVDSAGNITLFDFDDCVYGWYIYDIAMVLFYAAVDVKPAERGQFTEKFMRDFLLGYGRENQIDTRWFVEIPHFLKLREIDLYAVIHRSFDMANLDDPWCARYMDGRQACIENDVPFIDFDFGKLALLDEN